MLDSLVTFFAGLFGAFVEIMFVLLVVLFRATGFTLLAYSAFSVVEFAFHRSFGLDSLQYFAIGFVLMIVSSLFSRNK